MLVHRRKAHKFKRYKGVDIDSLLALEHDKRLGEIQTVMKMNPQSKEYQVLFKDGTVDWITILRDSHPKVQAFRKANNVNIEVYSPDLASWMNPIWIDDLH